MKTNMTQTWEVITPKKAEKWLTHNRVNRHVSKKTVEAYARDMAEGRWNEKGSCGISFDENGQLRDGQHRLCAIIMADRPISMWVCRNVAEDSIFDYGRKRTSADHIAIQRENFEAVYKTTKYTGVVNVILNNAMDRKKRTVFEVVEFTDNNKELLDGFFLKINKGTTAKISIVVVWAGMFFAYCAGVPTDKIMDFYEVLKSGMGEGKKDYPVIAYRNYLMSCPTTPASTKTEIARCEYAIEKYISGSGTKRTVTPEELIYPCPYYLVTKKGEQK